MNYKAIFSIIGKIMIIMGLFMILPLTISAFLPSTKHPLIGSSKLKFAVFFGLAPLASPVVIHGTFSNL